MEKVSTNRKDEVIRFIVCSKEKKDFENACDGRPMSKVLRDLMIDYVKQNQ